MMSLKWRLSLQVSLAAVAVVAGGTAAVYLGVPRWLTAVLCALLMLVVAYAIVFAALRPLVRMARQMEQLTADHIDQRLPHRQANDELAHLGAAFNALLERLETAFTSQKMFVANVSHELRTPLATLIATLDLARQRERQPAQYREAISLALDDAWRMSQLIDELLDLAKADYQQDQVAMEDVRLDELLVDVREHLLRAYPAFNVELLFANDAADDAADDDRNDAAYDDRCLTVHANVYLLRIAFHNLMENNCKYSSNHTSMVQISYYGEWSIVSLSDSGYGMTPDEASHLYQLFYRGQRARKAEGSGIGMTLVEKIVAMHHGQISVRTQEGEGTTFLIRLRHI